MVADVRVLVPLLPGFEEIEAVTIIDVLRRAELTVWVAGDRLGPVEGSHGIAVVADTALAEVDAASLAMIALPGGQPGATRLAEHPIVQRLLREVAAAGRYTAAICAAPIALAAAGLHEGRTVTSFPGLEERFAGAVYVESRVVIDGPVVTSRGAGTAMEFALALVGLLAGAETQEKLRQRMLAAPGEPARVVGP